MISCKNPYNTYLGFVEPPTAVSRLSGCLARVQRTHVGEHQVSEDSACPVGPWVLLRWLGHLPCADAFPCTKKEFLWKYIESVAANAIDIVSNEVYAMS